MPLRAHENILVFYQKLPTYNPQMTKGKPYVKVRKAEQFTKNYSSNCLKKEWVGINNGTRYPRDILKCHTHYTSNNHSITRGGLPPNAKAGRLAGVSNQDLHERGRISIR